MLEFEIYSPHEAVSIEYFNRQTGKWMFVCAFMPDGRLTLYELGEGNPFKRGLSDRVLTSCA